MPNLQDQYAGMDDVAEWAQDHWAECSGRCNERQGRGVCDCDEGRMTDSDRALRAAVWLGVLLFDAAVFVFLVNV